MKKVKNVGRFTIGSTINCKTCGKSFIIEKINQKYCSEICKKPLTAINNKKDKTAIGTTINCSKCGEEFIIEKRNQKHCKACATPLSLIRHKPSLIPCVECGTLFAHNGTNQVCCSEKCRIEKRNRKARERYQSFTVSDLLNCPICGKTFKPDGRRIKYCSLKCYRSAEIRKPDDKILKVTSMILDGCKDLDEAKEKVAELLGKSKKEKPAD